MLFKGKEVREKMIEMFQEHLKRVYLTREWLWMVLFPEGLTNIQLYNTQYLYIIYYFIFNPHKRLKKKS